MYFQADAKGGHVSLWRAKAVWAAFFVALLIRLVVVWAANSDIPRCCLEQGYTDATASLASGKGLLMSTQDSLPAEPIGAMKELEALGARLSSDHPYPPDDRGWIPATLHPAGYSVLLWAFYELGNYSGMLFLARFAPAVLDAFSCLLVFVFARNLFSVRVGLVAAWAYALLPSAVVLTLPFLPDSYARFFAILILSLASYARFGKHWALPTAGMAAGLGFHFRAEFLVWPIILWCCLMIDTRKILGPTLRMIPTGAAMLGVMLPWIIWTYHTTGQPMLSTSSAGASMYESLGEIPENPWKIVLEDAWIMEDARKRGFATAWAPNADEFYRRAWRQSILEYPGFFTKLVLTQRLPLALAPPYTYKRFMPQEFDFATIRKTEGLTKWGALQRYPLKALQYKGVEIMMAGLSVVLTAAMLGAAIVCRQNWRTMSWLIVPWLVTIASMCLVKQIEARNVSTVLVMQIVAFAISFTGLFDRWRQRRRLRKAESQVAV